MSIPRVGLGPLLFTGERRLQLASAAAAALGVGLATYIAVAESGGGVPACLVGGGGCETVAESTYAQLAGVNVAVLGIVGYVFLLGAALLASDLGRFGSLFLALVGFGFSMYLTYLELFTIEAICQWCVASAALMTVLLILAVVRTCVYGLKTIDPSTTRVESLDA